MVDNGIHYGGLTIVYGRVIIMDEEKSACKCKCDSKDAPVTGNIIVYELAVIIILLIFILLDLDKLSEQPTNDLEQSREEN